MDTGDERANMTFGTHRGVPCGKMIEIAGEEHAGKTLIALFMAAKAQEQHNAFVINVDLDSTYDKPWTNKIGVKTDSKNFYLCQPKKIQKFKWEKKTVKVDGRKIKKRVKVPIGKPFLEAANHIMAEVEEVVAWVKEQWPTRPIFLFIDSLADVQTQMVKEKGMEPNMRTRMDRSLFFADLMPRWKHWGRAEDMWIVWLNQIRYKPGAFGDPKYAGGGKAKDHACAARVWAIRLKGGQLKRSGQTIGIKGKFVNFKNKAGQESEVGHSVGFVYNFSRPIERGWKWMDAKEAKDE
jgi:RecA/RadA recombinase